VRSTTAMLLDFRPLLSTQICFVRLIDALDSITQVRQKWSEMLLDVLTRHEVEIGRDCSDDDKS
jgi:hypothetical protein